jgi:hypothetical protein
MCIPTAIARDPDLATKTRANFFIASLGFCSPSEEVMISKQYLAGCMMVNSPRPFI